MKKSIIPGIVISIMLLFVSCDMDSIFSGNTTVRVSVKPLVNEKVLQNNASRALLSFNEQTITLKAEADGMTPITQTLAYDSAKGAFSGSVTIEKGKNVTFTVEAKDAKGTVYVKGTETKTLEKATEKVVITLVPVLSDANKKETGLVFSDSFEGDVNGEVKAVAFAPAMPFDVTYTYKALNVAVTVSNREGKTLVNENNEWSMKQGEEVILLYTKTGETPMLLVYPKLVTVTFDANGGTGSMENQLIVTNLKANLIKNTFTKEGWAFTGWNTAKDGKGTSYADAAEVTLAVDTTLYAQWKQSTVSVSFNANGGTGTMSAQSVVPNTATALTKNAFTKEGYTFTGWNTAKDGTGTKYADGASISLSSNVTLYAQWIQNTIPVQKITVTFNANNGTSATTTQTMDANTATLLTANAFTKEGYTFIGWNTVQNAGVSAYADGASVTLSSNVTLYAQWIQNAIPVQKITVTFNANNDTSATTTQTMDANTTTSLTANTFTKEGYTFIGWNTAQGGTGTSYADGASVNMSANVILYAQWEKEILPPVVVTFNANGGSGSMTPQTMNANVPTMLSPNTFTKDGFVFAAWCDASDPVAAGYITEGSTDYTSEHFLLDKSVIAISSNITLYAQWLEVVPAIVTFDANGGTGSMSSIEVSVGDYITLPANSFSKDGYTFNGWVISEYPIGTIGDEAYIPVAGNMTLVAQWTPNSIPSETVTVYFNANGGTGTMGSQEITPGVATALTANTFTKDGYVFIGWYRDTPLADNPTETDIDFSLYYLDEVEVTVESISPDMTFYAIWETAIPGPVTVTFNANGGNGYMTPLEAAVGDTVTLPANSFTYTGYTFSHWVVVGYENLGIIDNESEFIVPLSVTLLAQWTPNAIPVETVTITFDANGGTGTMADLPAISNTKIALTKNTFIKEGFEFLCWTTYDAPYDGSFFNADGNFVYDEKFFDAEGNLIRAS